MRLLGFCFSRKDFERQGNGRESPTSKKEQETRKEGNFSIPRQCDASLKEGENWGGTGNWNLGIEAKADLRRSGYTLNSPFVLSTKKSGLGRRSKTGREGKLRHFSNVGTASKLFR